MSLYDIPEMLTVFSGPEGAARADEHPQPYTPRNMGGPCDLQGTPLPTPISVTQNPILPAETVVDKLPSNYKQNAASLSVLSLLGVAHQLELHLARPPQELYMTLAIVRSALQKLHSIADCQAPDQEQQQQQQQKAGLMESIVAQQVTGLLFEAYNGTFCSEPGPQRYDPMYTAPGGNELHGASALGIGPSTALHHVDEDDRRAIQAVVVQRQVKRALAVLQRLRRRNKTSSKPQGGMGGASSGGTSIDEEAMTGVMAASKLSLEDAERRLIDLAEMLQKYADLNL